MAYYRLKKQYILRGWDGSPWCLFYDSNKTTKLLTKSQFDLLLMCDGESAIDRNTMTSEQAAFLDTALENKIIEIISNPLPLNENQYYYYYSNRRVDSVMWSITGKCNFFCRHCYMNAPEGEMGELSHHEILSILDEIESVGIYHLSLTGGEPFVRKDFWEIIDVIKDKGMIIDQIYTNGWLLTEKVLEEFSKRGMLPEFSFSFDGLGWHDWMRRVNGAEDRVIKAINACKKNGFPFNVEVCLHQGNRHLIRKTINYLANLGVPVVRLGTVANTELWINNNEGNEYSSRDYFSDIIKYIPYYYSDKPTINILAGNVISLTANSPTYHIVAEKFCNCNESEDEHLCGSARWNVYITPEGRLLPCMPMTACEEQNLFPLIQDIGLQAGLSNSYYMNFVNGRVKDLLAVNEKCNSCEHKYVCGGGCRAVALMESHDLMGSENDMCILWNEGYVDRIHQVADEAIAKYCNQEASDE